MRTLVNVLDDVHSLYPRLAEGDTGVIGIFGDKATIDSPLGGRQQPAEFVSETRAWLARHAAHSVQVHDTITPARIIHELVLYLTVDGEERELPVMLIVDVEDDYVRDLRVYHSTWPLTGSHILRPPLMQYDVTDRPPEPVGTYHEALASGDAELADSVFEADGCVREPAGGRWVYCGGARTEWYRDILRLGGISLHLGTVTDDGTTVVYEYMADRWAGPMTPQAGAAAYQRGTSGKLAAARIYDDVQPPAALGDV